MKKSVMAITVAVALFGMAVFSWSAEQKIIRSLDNPPSAPLKVEPNIPAEYEGLVKIFDSYWTAFKNKKYKETYALESADFRKVVGFDQYKSKFGKDLVVKSVRALGVKKINEKEVVVTGNMILQVPGTGTLQDSYRPLKDTWVKEGVSWRHVRPVEGDAKK